MHPAAVAVVGAKIVVVPYGVIGTNLKQPPHLRCLSGMSVPMHETLIRLEVHLAQVNVVAEPEHHVGLLVRHAFENRIPPTIRCSWTVVLRLVDESAAACHKRKSRRVHAIIPQHLRDTSKTSSMAFPFNLNLTLYVVPGSKLARVMWAVCPDVASVCTGKVDNQAVLGLWLGTCTLPPPLTAHRLTHNWAERMLTCPTMGPVSRAF